MTAQVIQLFTARDIARHEAQNNRDEWAAVGTQGDYAAQVERQRREAAERWEAAEMARWRMAAACAVAFVLGCVFAGVL